MRQRTSVYGRAPRFPEVLQEVILFGLIWVFTA
jgi:hypothetical protein